MGFVGLLLVCFGAFGIACGSNCVPETAKCSQYWQKIEPHKDLMENEKELNLWCNKQYIFYQCLEEVLLEGKNGNLSYLPTNLLISKLFAQDLCSDGSTSRRRHLNNAACINQLNTEICTLPEFLDIVTLDDTIPPSKCSLSEKTFSCIAATMVLNCGFDAGKVYRTMLKITRYSEEVCDVDAIQGIPHCNEPETKDRERDEKLSEIYYGLVHRIGSIPEQGPPASSYELDGTGGVDGLVRKVIISALDSLDANAVSEEYRTHEVLDHKPDMKNPIITYVYKGILFYNYSDVEYAAYWRQPDFVIIENITCDHLRHRFLRGGSIFQCQFEYRTHDPDCVSNATEHENVTPQLIRDLDPEIPDDSITEFGPRPEWMKDFDNAYEKRMREQMKSDQKPHEETDISDTDTLSFIIFNIAEAMIKPESEIKLPQHWYEYKSEDRNSIFPNDIHAELMELSLPESQKYELPINQFQIGNGYLFFIHEPLISSALENATCTRLDECHPRAKGIWKCRMWRRKTETCDTCYAGTGANILGQTGASPEKLPLEESESRFMVLETTDPTVVPEILATYEDPTSSAESIAFHDSYAGVTEESNESPDVMSNDEPDESASYSDIKEEEIQSVEDLDPTVVPEILASYEGPTSSAESIEFNDPYEGVTDEINESPDMSNDELDDSSSYSDMKEEELQSVEDLDPAYDDVDLERDIKVLILDNSVVSDENSDFTTELVYAIDNIETEYEDELEAVSPDEHELFSESLLEVILEDTDHMDNIHEYSLLDASDVDNAM